MSLSIVAFEKFHNKKDSTYLTFKKEKIIQK